MCKDNPCLRQLPGGSCKTARVTNIRLHIVRQVIQCSQQPRGQQSKPSTVQLLSLDNTADDDASMYVAYHQYCCHMLYTDTMRDQGGKASYCCHRANSTASWTTLVSCSLLLLLLLLMLMVLLLRLLLKLLQLLLLLLLLRSHKMLHGQVLLVLLQLFPVTQCLLHSPVCISPALRIPPCCSALQTNKKNRLRHWKTHDRVALVSVALHGPQTSRTVWCL